MSKLKNISNLIDNLDRIKMREGIGNVEVLYKLLGIEYKEENRTVDYIKENLEDIVERYKGVMVSIADVNEEELFNEVTRKLDLAKVSLELFYGLFDGELYSIEEYTIEELFELVEDMMENSVERVNELGSMLEEIILIPKEYTKEIKLSKEVVRVYGDGAVTELDGEKIGYSAVIEKKGKIYFSELDKDLEKEWKNSKIFRVDRLEMEDLLGILDGELEKKRNVDLAGEMKALVDFVYKQGDVEEAYLSGYWAVEGIGLETDLVNGDLMFLEEREHQGYVICRVTPDVVELGGQAVPIWLNLGKAKEREENLFEQTSREVREE